MPKKIFTDHDIEDLFKQGVTSLNVDQNTLLTDLAYEKARRLGLHLVFDTFENPPSAPVLPYVPGSGAAISARGGASPVPTRIGEDPASVCLRFTPQTSETALRAAVVETGRLAYAQGLMISNDGNISVRMGDGRILITPSGLCKGRISPQDLLVIDIDGSVLQPAADPALKPTSEQPMHLEVYRQRPDVCAVIHTHLIFANALVISKGVIRMDILPEAAATFGNVPITDFCMPSSEQNAQAVRALIPHTNVLMIRNHGSLTVGAHLDEALIHLERLEHIAKTLTYAELLGSPNPLPSEMLTALQQMIGRS